MHLIAAQLVFAYAFDILLTWSRRERYTLGFGPFPVIFSINLFLWFKVDWFYWQFLMIAIGFAAKELIRWNKDGRRAHIFNPSSFPLGLFSLVLIVTGTTGLTWGPEIAITLLQAPHIYLLIFAVSLPAQVLFGVASMTLSAVATTYGLGLVYYATTGTYLFNNASIPIAVFLGMHLLFNDPSTSPRTELGRIMFGALYGLGVMILFGLLGQNGIPTHYDKLLAVPILNLMIKGIDTLARSRVLGRVDPATIGATLSPRRRNLAYIAVWVVAGVDADPDRPVPRSGRDTPAGDPAQGRLPRGTLQSCPRARGPRRGCPGGRRVPCGTAYPTGLRGRAARSRVDPHDPPGCRCSRPSRGGSPGVASGRADRTARPGDVGRALPGLCGRAPV